MLAAGLTRTGRLLSDQRPWRSSSSEQVGTTYHTIFIHFNYLPTVPIHFAFFVPNFSFISLLCHVSFSVYAILSSYLHATVQACLSFCIFPLILKILVTHLFLSLWWITFPGFIPIITVLRFGTGSEGSQTTFGNGLQVSKYANWKHIIGIHFIFAFENYWTNCAPQTYISSFQWNQ